MNIYIKTYDGIYCSGGNAIIAAHTVKEADSLLKNHKDVVKTYGFEFECFDKAKIIKLAKYNGVKPKVLAFNPVQE